MIVSTPQIGVIMCVHNAGRYLCPAIESILGQTFRDFVFVIVDDGSTDGSAAVVQLFRDPRIRFLRQTNSGPAAARNAGLQAIRTPHVAFMDADDISEPNRLKAQYAFLQEHPDVAAVGCAARIVDQDGRLALMQHVPTGAAFCRQRMMSGRFYAYGASLMVRREALDRVGAYRPFFRQREDVDLMLRLAEHYAIDNLPQPLYRYRINLKGLSHSDVGSGVGYHDLAFAFHRERLTVGSDPLQRGERPAPPDGGVAFRPIPSKPKRILAGLHLDKARLLREMGASWRATAQVVCACLCLPTSRGVLREGLRILLGPSD